MVNAVRSKVVKGRNVEIFFLYIANYNLLN